MQQKYEFGTRLTYFWHKNEKKISLNFILIFKPLRFWHTCRSSLSKFPSQIKLIQYQSGPDFRLCRLSFLCSLFFFFFLKRAFTLQVLQMFFGIMISWSWTQKTLISWSFCPGYLKRKKRSNICDNVLRNENLYSVILLIPPIFISYFQRKKIIQQP